jgi:hypothetical protein
MVAQIREELPPALTTPAYRNMSLHKRICNILQLLNQQVPLLGLVVWNIIRDDIVVADETKKRDAFHMIENLYIFVYFEQFTKLEEISNTMHMVAVCGLPTSSPELIHAFTTEVDAAIDVQNQWLNMQVQTMAYHHLGDGHPTSTGSFAAKNYWVMRFYEPTQAPTTS